MFTVEVRFPYMTVTMRENQMDFEDRSSAIACFKGEVEKGLSPKLYENGIQIMRFYRPANKVLVFNRTNGWWKETEKNISEIK